MEIRINTARASIFKPGDVVSVGENVYIVIDKTSTALRFWQDEYLSDKSVVVLCVTGAVGRITWFNESSALKYEGRLVVVP